MITNQDYHACKCGYQKKHCRCPGVSESTETAGYGRVLLLASYCNEDGCTEDFPCADCLQMCNIAIVSKKDMRVLGDFGQMREVA